MQSGDSKSATDVTAKPLWLSRGDCVAQYRDEMADAPRGHEQVPYHMVVSHAPRRVERDSAGVGESAGRDPEDAGGRNVVDQRLDRDDDQPPHREIQTCRQVTDPEPPQDFRPDSDQGKRPDDGQQRPAPRSAQWSEREGRIRSGDEKVNRRMIQDSKDALPLRQRQSVINRRSSVQQNERDAKNRGTRKSGSVVRRSGFQQQNWKSDYACNQTSAVGDAVGYFLAN